MQIRIFTIPIVTDSSCQEELNQFLRSHKIVDIRSELAVHNGNSFWSFCITYMASGASDESSHQRNGRYGKTDYKQELPDEVFKRFVRMRSLRKEIAENEAIPAYAVFTDAELAELAKLEVLDTSSMAKIPGIGKKKIEKYGNAFCMIDYTSTDEHEASGTPDRTDSID